MENRRSVRAVLFDAGDTLFRLRGSVGEVYARAAQSHGVSVPSAELDVRFRQVFRESPPLCFEGTDEEELARHEYAWWRDVVQRIFAGAVFPDFDGFYRELFDYFAQSDAWDLFPDTLPALDRLVARGLRLGVVSNFDSRLETILVGFGLYEKFEVVVVSGRAGAAKPDPRIFHHALDRLGLGPDEVLHIGDSEREDLGGATAAGLRALRIDRSLQESVDSSTITSLVEIETLL